MVDPTPPHEKPTASHPAGRSALDEAKVVFSEALHVPGHEREAYIENACRGNAWLASLVRDLLAADEDIESNEVFTAGTESRALTGTQIGRYRVLGLLGEGGFGNVYSAEQREPVERTVALKVVKLGMDTRQIIARFEAERQALALMDHPNIARIFDGGATGDGRPYFVMELVKGVPITEYCDRHKLSIDDRLELFCTICEAVQHAHQKGIIHRDIKPSNVLVALRDVVAVPKVIDFGIAKAIDATMTEKTVFTREGQMIGTPEYMSPEQAGISAFDIDTRSDVYSLGVLLYELLTGTTPFEGLRSGGFAEIQRIIREIRESDPIRPSTRLATLGDLAQVATQRSLDARRLRARLRGDLDWIVLKALEKDRTRRYESASALAAELRRYLNDEPTEAGRPDAILRARKFVRRHRAGVTVAAILAIGSAVGLSGLVYGTITSERARVAELRRDLADQRRQEAVTSSTEFVESIVNMIRPDARGAGIDAKAMVEAAVDAADVYLDDLDLVDQAALRSKIGIALLGAREPALALDPLRKSADLYRQANGPDHVDTLNAEQLLGITHREANDLDEAEPILRDVASRLAALKGPNDADALIAAGNHATTLYYMGRLDEAAGVYERILAASVESVGPDHRLGWEQNLATIMLDQLDYAAAEPLLRNVCTQLEELYPAGAAISFDALGQALEGLHRLGEAEAAYRRALQLRADLYGPDSDLAMQSTAHLGHVVREQGRPQEAVELLEPAVPIVTREDFPDTIQAIDARYSVLFELALGYRDLRRYDAAITAARQAVDAAKKLDGGGGEFSQRALRLLDELESDDHARG